MTRTIHKYDPATRTFTEISEEDARRKRPVEAPFVISDEIPPTESMATAEGKIFTSKRKLDNFGKSHGFRITGEVERAKPPSPPTQAQKDQKLREMKEIVEKAAMDIKYDRTPVSEREREICRQEERRYRDYRRERER